MVTYQGATFSHGLVIKLYESVAIDWDGRLVRHCSSIVDPGIDNLVFGSFWCASDRHVLYNKDKVASEKDATEECLIGKEIIEIDDD